MHEERVAKITETNGRRVNELFDKICVELMDVVNRHKGKAMDLAEEIGGANKDIAGVEASFAVGLVVQTLVSTVFSISRHVSEPYDEDYKVLAQKFIAAGIAGELKNREENSKLN